MQGCKACSSSVKYSTVVLLLRVRKALKDPVGTTKICANVYVPVHSFDSIRRSESAKPCNDATLYRTQDSTLMQDRVLTTHQPSRAEEQEPQGTGSRTVVYRASPCSPYIIRSAYVSSMVSSACHPMALAVAALYWPCLLYTSPSPRDRQKSRMPSSA